MAASWFPVNPDHLKKIQDGLSRGAYDLDVDFLISEIQNDLALYTFTLKEARRRLGDTGIALSPEQLLRKTGLTNLNTILQTSPDKISTFDLEKAEELQSLRLKDAVISAGAAEVMAHHRNLSGNLGYTTEVIRQLGLTLISWNYPEEYKRSMAAYAEGADLEIELTKNLGFSAALFGIAIARQWGLCPELRIAVGDTGFKKQQTKLVNTASTLTKICEVGEALARANNPKQHPNAKKDWKIAKSRIEAMLGANGIHTIEEHIKDQCEHYSSIAPEIFGEEVDLNPTKSIIQTPRNEKFLDNRYIRHCPRDIQNRLEQVYNSFSPDPATRQTCIITLAEEICPRAGFEYGCIFLLQPDTMTLTPRLTIGKLPPKTFKNYHAMSVSTRNPDPITSAYHCNTPIVQGSDALTPFGEASISSVLGRSQRVGVLYLEPSPDLLDLRDSSALQRFKALCQTLHDCLSLS